MLPTGMVKRRDVLATDHRLLLLRLWLVYPKEMLPAQGRSVPIGAIQQTAREERPRDRIRRGRPGPVGGPVHQ